MQNKAHCNNLIKHQLIEEWIHYHAFIEDYTEVTIKNQIYQDE